MPQRLGVDLAGSLGTGTSQQGALKIRSWKRYTKNLRRDDQWSRNWASFDLSSSWLPYVSESITYILHIILL